MQQNLTIAQIRVIATLAATRRVNMTARELAITQPSVSKHLATLESRYGHRLFDRQGQFFVPTELCERLLPRLRTLLALADELGAELDGLRGLREGRLRVGYSTHQFVMHVLGAFMDSFRGIKIEARCMASFDLLDKLRAGNLDAAFVTMPGAEADLHMLELRREELVLMTGPDHPLAGKDSISLRDLSAWPLIQREVTSGTRRTLEANAVREGAALNTVLDLGSWESMRDAVAAGIGVGVVMAGEICEDRKMRSIRIQTGRGKVLTVGHYLVCVSEARDLATIKALFDLTERVAVSTTLP
ncbi:LysR substrate-binding domain-containing protein [Roseibaca calidilacus]|nr:LysR substrate-binding domain-containing protein [Roseibaca calidilacus]